MRTKTDRKNIPLSPSSHWSFLGFSLSFLWFFSCFVFLVLFCCSYYYLIINEDDELLVPTLANTECLPREQVPWRFGRWNVRNRPGHRLRWIRHGLESRYRCYRYVPTLGWLWPIWLVDPVVIIVIKIIIVIIVIIIIIIIEVQKKNKKKTKKGEWLWYWCYAAFYGSSNSVSGSGNQPRYDPPTETSLTWPYLEASSNTSEEYMTFSHCPWNFQS